ncbi:MAG: anti-sigma-I factor RsgI family protein, partial [Bacillota bacterium]
MSKRNVLVLEVGSSVMKVLTDEGDFLRLPVPADRPRKGQRLVLEEPEKRPALARIGIAVAAAAVIILTAWIGLSQGVPAPPVVALTVALDLNPSLLLGVGADGQVLQVTPANEDGERLSYPTLPAPLPATLTMLLSSASEQGYLRSEPEDVLVFSAWHSPGESPQIDVEGALRQALSDLRLQARLIPLEPGTRDVEEAARLGIPVNRLLIAHRAQAMGLTLSSADLEGAGLVRGLEIIGVLPVPTNPKPATPTPELPDRLPPAPAPAVPAQPAPIKEAPQRPTPVQPPPAGDHSEQPKGAPTQPKSAPTQPESAPTQP